MPPPSLAGVHGPPAGANGPPPPLEIIFLCRDFFAIFPYWGPFSLLGGHFCYYFLLMVTFLSLYRISLLFFFYRRAFLLRFSLYNDYIANFFIMWGPFCYVFFLYNDYIGNIFYHVGAFLLHFSPFGGLFCPIYIARLCYFSSMWVAFCCIFLYIGNIFYHVGRGLSAVFFSFGGPFLGLPPPSYQNFYVPIATPHHMI